MNRVALDVGRLIDRMLSGDRTALAKLITLVENRGAELPDIMSRLHGHYGKAYVVGITGPPGAGKSTLLDQLIGRFRAEEQQVGVVAVDPSSPFSGGAVLGDRIRMQSHFLDSGVFIRSLSARGSVGGLARATRDVARVLDAFGKDIVVVETVGVGQNEFDVMKLAKTVIVVLVPEAGDTIQTMKAGLLEVADVFVVNKADRDGALRIKAELEMMLELRANREWPVPVILTVAQNGTGLDELVLAIKAHRAFSRSSGQGAEREMAGRRDEFLSFLRSELDRRLERGLASDPLRAACATVERGEIDPYTAALRVLESDEVVAALLGRPPCKE